MGVKLSKIHYLKPTKIVRDLVHEYVNLTQFDLDLIDTASFQRLKDIRQLTCQHVYPAARHTRFEHSLGVLELTRQAIKHLNKNGVLGIKPAESSQLIIDENLGFNASIAALLHDVGHCPFSHMGETEFDPLEVKEYLLDTMKENEQLKLCSDLLEKISKSLKGIGAVHEQLSCIVILEKYGYVLTTLTVEAFTDEDVCTIKTDFELIVRSILGIEYDVSTAVLFQKNKLKNVIVRLINSSIFDMDKLDYIMRDSFFTGIGTPVIDTKRLFRNMYFSNKLSLVFTSKAVPSLQNMIDARDGLYMYVYNHHAVVFSDFMNTYISRRLAHSADDFLSIVYPTKSGEELKDELDMFQISALGLVPKPYLFSVGAVLDVNRSDSDWLSLLNIIYSHNQDSLYTIQATVRGEIYKLICEKDIEITDEEIARLSENVHKALKLVYQYKTRQFLKPWWKTVFEFSNFMNQYFRDDNIRKQVSKFICDGGEYTLEAAEFRSQIAKHVIYITQKLSEESNPSLIEPLGDGDFFVIQRSNRFFAPNTIEKLEICLKSSEFTGPPIDINYQTQEYYVKNLTNIIPQKNYSSIYAKEGFYIFSKPISKEYDEQTRKRHYKFLEQIFVFVCNEFVRRGEQSFIQAFQQVYNPSLENKMDLKKKETQAEIESMERMITMFKKQFYL